MFVLPSTLHCNSDPHRSLSASPRSLPHAHTHAQRDLTHPPALTFTHDSQIPAHYPQSNYTLVPTPLLQRLTTPQALTHNPSLHDPPPSSLLYPHTQRSPGPCFTLCDRAFLPPSPLRPDLIASIETISNWIDDSMINVLFE